MQDAQLRWMVGLSLLVLVLVAALGYAPGGGEDPVDPDATGVVWELPDIGAVTRIEREVSGERLVLVRGPDGWTVEAPTPAEADDFVVERLLDDFREMDRGIPIDVGPGDAEAFGLGDPPAARVRLTLTDGRTLEADYGEPAPVGWRTYARDRDGRVVAVGGQSDLLFKPASAFRDHRLFDFDPAAVRRVTLVDPPHTLSVSGEGRRWWVDGFTRADPDRVDDLVMGLLDLRFDRILDVDPVAEPRIRVEVELADGAVHTLRVGERTPMGTLVTSPRATGVVFPESLALLKMGPTDVGDRQAIPIDLERDTRVRVEAGGRSWEATRDGREWHSADLDADATRDRLARLAAAQIAYTLDPVEPPEEIVATVTVWRGEERRTVRIGPERDDGFHHAVDADGGAPYRVRAAELSGLL